MTQRKFSDRSKKFLKECDERFEGPLNDVLQMIDCSIIEGHRDQKKQDSLFPKFTKVAWPQSKHNKWPSQAIHVVPYLPLPIGALTGNKKQINVIAAQYGITYEQAEDVMRDSFSFLAGAVIAASRTHGLKVRWGGDWDRDGELFDNKFDDLAHYEIDGTINVPKKTQETDTMDSKPLVTSKTAGANVLAPVLSFALAQSGVEVPAEVQLSILAGVNLVIRWLFTNTGISSLF